MQTETLSQQTDNIFGHEYSKHLAIRLNFQSAVSVHDAFGNKTQNLHRYRF